VLDHWVVVAVNLAAVVAVMPEVARVVVVETWVAVVEWVGFVRGEGVGSHRNRESVRGSSRSGSPQVPPMDQGLDKPEVASSVVRRCCLPMDRELDKPEGRSASVFSVVRGGC
jgi:hypothetical protein